MNTGFIFNKIRCSVVNENQIALQGYCTKHFMDGRYIEALLYSGTGHSEKLEASWFITGADENETQKLHEYGLTHIISIMISLPQGFNDADAVLKVTVNSVDEVCGLYTCSGIKLIKCMKQLNSAVESVKIKDGNIVIRGWAADRDEIAVSITRMMKSKAEKVPFDIVWSERPDIDDGFAEYEGGKCGVGIENGFEICIAKSRFSCRIEFRAGRRYSVHRMKAVKSCSRFAVINKLSRYWYKGIYSLNNYGMGETAAKLKRRFLKANQRKQVSYAKWFAKRMPDGRELKRQRAADFEYKPLFSVIVQRDEESENKVCTFIESVKEQTYTNYELCTGSSIRESIADAKGDYIVFGECDAQLTPDALYECTALINTGKADIIYCDEDVIDLQKNICGEADFKPDFNIDLLRSCNYIRHIMAVSKQFLQKIIANTDKNYAIDSTNYGFILRCIENTDKISHISKVVYRRTGALNQASRLQEDAAGNCVQSVNSHLERCHIAARAEQGDREGICKVSYEVKGNPLISIIIPNKDHAQDLKRCMDSIDSKSDYRNYEYIIVENNSTEQETFDFYRELAKRENVTILYWNGGFNYSAINNHGENVAKGEYLLLLNNDTEIVNSDCISQMLGYCQREDVGIVGARLFYDDGTIQHAGVVIGLGGIAGNIFAGSDEKDGVYRSRTEASCDYSAVTAACLMVKRSLYEELGGLDEELEVAFNDIDFCLRVRQMNKLVVYNANARLYHYESKSRGMEDTLEKQDRFNDEIELFNEKWGEILKQGDPYYNPNLTLDKPDFSLSM